MTVYLIQHAEKERAPGDPGITDHGRTQAEQVGAWAREAGVRHVYCSPLRRARETARIVADALGSADVTEDARAVERMNWDGSVPVDEFTAEWNRTVEDRTHVPSVGGDSSYAAATRLLALAMVLDLRSADGPIAVVTHGGVTVDLLRTLLGDEAVERGLMTDGVPACAVTTLEGAKVVALPSVRSAVAGDGEAPPVQNAA